MAGKSPLRALGPLNMGLTAAFEGPDAYKRAKGYTAQQRERRKSMGRVPPGGVPPMKKLSARNALMSILHSQMEKNAVTAKDLPKGFPFGSALKSLPGALAMGAGLAGGGLLAAKAGRGVGSVFQSFQANRMFRELQRRYPEIKRHPKAREYFDLIVAYAPSLMRHPAAIGDFLRRQLEYPMSSVEFIKQLADLEGAVAKTEASSAAARFGQDVVSGGQKTIGPMSEYGYQSPLINK
jgi:hypothetical protein